jgi:DNA repair exonuclease SbcCD nuclease subunit
MSTISNISNISLPNGSKVLAVGDIHIKLDNLPDIQLFMKRLEQEIIQRKPDFLVLLGDVLHTHERLHTSCLHQADLLFSMCTSYVPTYVLVGNHDYISNSQFLTSNHWMTPFRSWKNLTIVDTVHVYLHHENKFVFCPYVPDGRFVEALDTYPDWKTASMIFGHQSLDGVKMGAITTEKVEEWKPVYPFLCCGHIHDKQRVQPNLYYTGTPMQHAFGEKHNKTICEFTVENGIITNQEEINLKVSVKRIEYITVAQAYHYSLQIEPHEMVRITVKGTKEECGIFKKSPAYHALSKVAKVVCDEIEVDEVVKEEVTSTFHEVLYDQIKSQYFLTKLYKEYAALPHSTDVQFIL